MWHIKRPLKIQQQFTPGPFVSSYAINTHAHTKTVAQTHTRTRMTTERRQQTAITRLQRVIVRLSAVRSFSCWTPFLISYPFFTPKPLHSIIWFQLSLTLTLTF